MALSWNEIKSRAIQFSKEWENETSEDAEAKSFWDDFFHVFGISRRRVAAFETKVTKGNRKDGYIDLLWKGQLLIEHKSAGKNLDRAYKQATDYFQGLKEHELPRYIVVCNFREFRLYDLDEGSENEFQLSDLINNIQLFGFIAGYQKRIFKEEDPVNIEAAMGMGKLHDKLNEIGYSGHRLELYLVRLLFCLFADDTSIFERGIFQEYLELKTKEDGSDLAYHISAIFSILNTPCNERLSNLDESINAFPFVNGKLFEEVLPLASFDSVMRDILLNCCRLDWSKISPAIFGSMFQRVMDPGERRNIGAHYTSEKNILKIIKPLFLDELWEEFELIKGNANKLKSFHRKMSSFRFLDPACGCGNFLVITYRELRLLEIEIIKKLQKGQFVTNVGNLINCNIDRFYGIEHEEFPVQIAKVAMWLIDHQMNMLVSNEFGDYFIRLPLYKSAKIIHGNSLRTDWNSIIDPLPSEYKTDLKRFDYIFGNPPFVGKQQQSSSQKADMKLLFGNINGAGVLDYVTAWYIKGAEYINSNADNGLSYRSITKIAFVSTNSIVQGEQVGILWNVLYNKFKIKIHFAHQTFKWGNEARNNAAVHVVIIGFSNFDCHNKKIFHYDDIKGDPQEINVKNINPYLVEGNDILVLSRNKPICNSPEIFFGSMPNDGGHFLFDKEQMLEFIRKEPGSKKLFKQIIGAEEFIHNKKRYCIWLKNVEPVELMHLKEVQKIIQLVKEARLKSKRPATKNLAKTPMLFGEIRQPTQNYIAIPEVSSEKRKYIPIGFIDSKIIASNRLKIVPSANLFHFGILTSAMHMTWTNYVCGRLESRITYSNNIVYNNFPWPINPSRKQIEFVKAKAKLVLDERKNFPKSSLGDLYEPLIMPSKLLKAHDGLDKAVDSCYRKLPFKNETIRIEFLFDLYEKYLAELFTKEKSKRSKKKISQTV